MLIDCDFSDQFLSQEVSERWLSQGKHYNSLRLTHSFDILISILCIHSCELITQLINFRMDAMNSISGWDFDWIWYVDYWWLIWWWFWYFGAHNTNKSFNFLMSGLYVLSVRKWLISRLVRVLWWLIRFEGLTIENSCCDMLLMVLIIFLNA